MNMEEITVCHLTNFDFCAVCIYKMLHTLHIGNLPILHIYYPQKLTVAMSMLMHCRTVEGNPLPVDFMVYCDGNGNCESTPMECYNAVKKLLLFDTLVWRNVINEYDLWEFVWPCYPDLPESENDTPLVRVCGGFGCRCEMHVKAWEEMNYNLIEIPKYNNCKPCNRQKIVL